MASSQLSWVTPPGTIANFLIGSLSTVDLLVVDTKNTGSTFNFAKISGDLPPGMTLSSSGVIAGTPVYSTPSNNYFTTLNYDFVVRVTSSDNRILNGKFTIIITNTVNQDFTWITPAGTLGTVPNGNFYSLKIEADSSANLGISYSFISGELPPGMQLISHDLTKTVATSQFTANTMLKLTNIQTIGVNDYVFGDKIPTNTRVSNVNIESKTIFLNANTTAPVEAGETIKFYSPGLIQGVPTILDPVAVNESRNYRFSIRATNSLGRITDRTFSLNVTNIYGPIIEPETTFLGSYFDGTYYNQQLEVLQLNPNVEIEWLIISGELPPGLSFTSTGTIQGYLEPVELIGEYGPSGYDGSSSVGGVTTDQQQYDDSPYQFNQLSQNLAYTFTVQAFDGANYDLQTYVINVVSRPGYNADSSLTVDDSFLTVDSGNIYVPVIRNTSSILPDGRQNSYYAYKIDGWDFDLKTGVSPLEYRIVNTLGTYDGSPFDPLARDDLNNGLPGSFDLVTATTSNLPGVLLDSDSGWIYGLLSQQTSAREEFTFGIEVCKTKEYGNVGNIALTTNANVTVDTTQYITQRFANSSVAANLSVLANITSKSTIYVTPVTGNVSVLANNSLWAGNVTSLDATALTSSFYQVEYCSPPKYFTLPVIGDPNSIINWISPAELGTIDNGTISELRIEAESAVGKELTYTLVDKIGVSCRLPQGLSLLPSGEITGRATFEAFTLDDYATTFDNNVLTVDRTATFVVKAETVDATASSTRTFTLKLNVIDKEPYENLYLKAMPSIEQRNIYNSLIKDLNIFNENFIYRATDPYYGIQEELKMLFLPGLTASELQEYQDAMVNNHFNKTYVFGDIKVATVLKDDYTPKYEVVYVEVVDPGEQVDGTGPAITKDLSSIIENPYIDIDGNTYNVIYPNSSENMKQRIEDTVGYQDQSSLPPWMTSNQPDATSTTGFTIPLGYTKAVVIAYAQPGAGEKIAYRIRKSNIDFNRIEFAVDRYQLDNYYSSNYSVADLTYINDRETTFDSDPNINVGTIVATVTYAVKVPYSQINGRPVSYIIANGGIDGVENFQTGDTLIFTKQEQFEDSGPYEGWVDYSDAFIGDNTETEIVEGFDKNQVGVYDAYTVIPGFLEKSMATAVQNKRGGVWRIEITNGIVNLVFVQELTVNDRVRVLFGKTLSSAILVYSIELEPGQTVPYYKVFVVNPTIRVRTTFNNDTTKFFTYRDQYYEPGAQDKYVKFPQYGVFN